jgi:hypothetical protein
MQQEKKQKRKDLLERILLWFWLTVLAVVVTGILIGSAWLYSMKGKF